MKQDFAVQRNFLLAFSQHLVRNWLINWLIVRQNTSSHHSGHKIIFSTGQFRNIFLSYSPAGRSVLGKTVPEVLDTARGWYSRQRAHFLPIRTDLGWWITFLLFSTTQRKACERPEHFRAVIMARLATNWTISNEQIVIVDRAPVAHFVEHWALMREAVSSTPAGPTLRVLK